MREKQSILSNNAFYLTMAELSFAQKFEQNCPPKLCLDESTLGIVIIARQFACAWQQEKNYTHFYLFGAAQHNIYLCMACSNVNIYTDQNKFQDRNPNIVQYMQSNGSNNSIWV